MLAGVILAVTVLAQRLGWSTFLYTNDEAWAVRGGRALADDLAGSIFDTTIFDRGPDRLNSLLHVVPNLVFGGVPDEFRAIHVVLALAFALAAVPVYLMARGVGVGRWPAVLVAALAILTPWTLYAGTMHNATVAYATNMLFAYAAWRTAVRPSWRNDLFVLGAAVLNLVARTGHTPFIVVALLAVLYAGWLRRPEEETRGRALLRLPRRVAREHSLLIGAFVLGVLVVAIVGPTRIVGSAYAVSGDFELPLRSIWDHTRVWVAMLTMGTGYLPVIIGGAWLLVQLVRPRSVETGVLAVVALGLFAVFCYASGNSYSTFEERYVSVFAGLPVVGFGAAIFRRETHPLGALLIGLVTLRAIATIGIPTVNDRFEYLVTPAKLTFAFPIRGRVASVIPGVGPDATLVASVLILVIAVALAAALWPGVLQRVARLRRVATPLAAAGALGVLALGTAAGAYAIEKYRTAMNPGKSFERVNFIDAASGGQPVFLYGHSWPDARGARGLTATNALHFNRSVCCTLWVQDVPDLLAPDGALPDRSVRYLARFPGFIPLAFETEVVRRSADLGAEMQVERFLGPPRAGARLREAADDGALPPDVPARLEIFPWVGVTDRCVRVGLGVPEGSRGPARYTVAHGTRRLAGEVRPGEQAAIELHSGSALAATVTSQASGRDRLYVTDLAVTRCG